MAVGDNKTASQGQGTLRTGHTAVNYTPANDLLDSHLAAMDTEIGNNASSGGGSGGGSPGGSATIYAEQILDEQTPDGTGTITFSAIDQTYDELEIVLLGNTDQVDDAGPLLTSFNGDTVDANYWRQQFFASNGNVTSTESASRVIAYMGNSASINEVRWRIPGYSNTTKHKTAVANFGSQETATAIRTGQSTLTWLNNSAITSITIDLNAGNYVAPTRFRLVGKKEISVGGGDSGGGSSTIFAKEKLADGVLSGDTITFDNIDQTYKNLYIQYKAKSTEAATTTNIRLELNDDTTATNYARQNLFNSNGGVSATEDNDNLISNISGTTAIANSFGTGIIVLRNYADTDNLKSAEGTLQVPIEIDATPIANTGLRYVTWNNTDAISKIVLRVAAGSFDAASEYELFGEKELEIGGGATPIASDNLLVDAYLASDLPVSAEVINWDTDRKANTNFVAGVYTAPEDQNIWASVLITVTDTGRVVGTLRVNGSSVARFDSSSASGGLSSDQIVKYLELSSGDTVDVFYSIADTLDGNAAGSSCYFQLVDDSTQQASAGDSDAPFFDFTVTSAQASIDINTIAQTGTDLRIEVSARGDSALANSWSVLLNGDATGASYYTQRSLSQNGTSTPQEFSGNSVGIASASVSPSGFFVDNTVAIKDYTSNTKNAVIKNVFGGPTATNEIWTGVVTTVWQASTNPITDVSILNGNGSGFLPGTRVRAWLE